MIVSSGPGNSGCKPSGMPYLEVNSSRYSWEMVDMAFSSCIGPSNKFSLYKNEEWWALLVLRGFLSRLLGLSNFSKEINVNSWYAHTSIFMVLENVHLTIGIGIGIGIWYMHRVGLVLVLLSVLDGSGCMVMLVISGSASVWLRLVCLVLHRILSGWLCLHACVCCLHLFDVVCLNLSESESVVLSAAVCLFCSRSS
ncbi:hypothetical protein Tco_1009097 [Tanacetum coccineum]